MKKKIDFIILYTLLGFFFIAGFLYFTFTKKGNGDRDEYSL